MVRALQASPVAFREHYLSGAMTADVVKTAQPTVEAPRDQDRFVEDGGGLQVTDPREFVDARDQLPGPAENPVSLAFVNA